MRRQTLRHICILVAGLTLVAGCSDEEPSSAGGPTTSVAGSGGTTVSASSSITSTGAGGGSGGAEGIDSAGGSSSTEMPEPGPDGGATPEGGQGGDDGTAHWSGDAEAPPGKFSCGTTFCEKGADVCVWVQSDVIGEPGGYHCQGLPSACTEGGPPFCPCLPLNLYDRCEQTIAGDLRIICPWYDASREGGIPICGGKP